MSISINPNMQGGTFDMNSAISGNGNVQYLMVLPNNNDSIRAWTFPDSSKSYLRRDSISLQNLCTGCSIHGNNDHIHSSGHNDHINGNNKTINGGSNISKLQL